MNKTIIIAAILMTALTSFVSCKKDFSYAQENLTGKWTETKPYLTGSNVPFILQFTANGSVIEISPYQDTGSYSLINGSTLLLDCNIPYGPVCNGLGSANHKISGDANNITISSFLGGGGISNPTSYNVSLSKNN